MAAATVALQTYLRTVIGLETDAKGLDRANTIIDEGIDSADELADLHDNKGVKILCANVCKPEWGNFKKHLDMVENHKEPKDLAPISKSFTIVDFFRSASNVHKRIAWSITSIFVLSD